MGARDELTLIESLRIVEHQLNVRNNDLLAEAVDVALQFRANIGSNLHKQILFALGQVKRLMDIIAKEAVLAYVLAELKVAKQIGVEGQYKTIGARRVGSRAHHLVWRCELQHALLKVILVAAIGHATTTIL